VCAATYCDPTHARFRLHSITRWPLDHAQKALSDLLYTFELPLSSDQYKYASSDRKVWEGDLFSDVWVLGIDAWGFQDQRKLCVGRFTMLAGALVIILIMIGSALL
jgi:hypothetical protein